VDVADAVISQVEVVHPGGPLEVVPPDGPQHVKGHVQLNNTRTHKQQ
jgi:hypothetical protein